VHTRQTLRVYDRHGAVDSEGEWKWQQVLENGWSGVRLEEWDDEVHVRKTGRAVAERAGNEDL
jgi:DMSO/TMAO reductase YedYZ molybdopterin-dependent catalytic subunit